jgi:hypothetical protein
MNIREDIQQLKTGDRDLRKFGLLVGGVFAGLGILFLVRHKPHGSYFLWPGAALLLAGAVLPRALKYVYLAWMSLAIVLGFVVAHVILTLLFFLVITPVGWFARLRGQDFLSLKLDRQSTSYWIVQPRKDRSASDYERQF